MIGNFPLSSAEFFFQYSLKWLNFDFNSFFGYFETLKDVELGFVENVSLLKIPGSPLEVRLGVNIPVQHRWIHG